MNCNAIPLLVFTLCLALLAPCRAGEIHDAVLKRDLTAVDRVLKRNPGQVNARTFPDCKTPLHLAVGAGNPGIVKRLLAAGANLSLADADSLTPLARAVIIVPEDAFTTFLADIALEMKRMMSRRPEPSRIDLLRAAILKKVASMPAAEREARIEVLGLLLGAKPELNKVSPDGRTPLHFAAAFGTEEVVKALLRAGANVDVRSAMRETPLHEAAAFDASGEMIQLLLQSGATIDALSGVGATPLMMAATGGSMTAVELLIAHQARLDAEDNKQVPVIAHAARAGKEDVVRLLLEKGGRSLVRDARKESLFHSAAAGGSKALVESLLKEGVDIDLRLNDEGYTPLLTAVEFQHPELAQWLMEKGADRAAKRKSGRGLLHIACEAGNKELVKDLIAAGANLQEEPNPLCDAARFGRVEIVELLLAHGADVNAKSLVGMTPLHVATANPAGVLLQKRLREVVTRFVPPEEDYAKVVELLLKHGAKVNVLSDDGQSAVHAAARYCDARVMRALIKAGADPSLPSANSKATPVIFAAATGRAETFRLLLGAGANIKDVNREGYPLLHVAASSGNAEVVKVLIAARVPVNGRALDGATALHCAAGANSFECVRLLLDAGADASVQAGVHGPTPLVLALGAKDVIAAVKTAEVEDQDRLLPMALNLRNRLQIVQLLLERGTVTDIVPRTHRSLVDFAKDQSPPEVVELLENAPAYQKSTPKR